jgi:hypothetical protein
MCALMLTCIQIALLDLDGELVGDPLGHQLLALCQQRVTLTTQHSVWP